MHTYIFGVVRRRRAATIARSLLELLLCSCSCSWSSSCLSVFVPLSAPTRPVAVVLGVVLPPQPTHTSLIICRHTLCESVTQEFRVDRIHMNKYIHISEQQLRQYQQVVRSTLRRVFLILIKALHSAIFWILCLMAAIANDLRVARRQLIAREWAKPRRAESDR